MICRRPHIALRTYIELVWSTGTKKLIAADRHEISLPGGSHHLVIRTGTPLRIFRSGEDMHGHEVGAEILAGMRLTPVRKAVENQPRVGAVLRPDALSLLPELAPAELVRRYTVLSDLWTARDVEDDIGRIRDSVTDAERLNHFECFLLRLFAKARKPHPLMSYAIRRLDEGARVDRIVAETGLSHRHFSARFRDTIGILPVEYRRLRRFDRLITALSQADRTGLAELAYGVGYSDQAQMAREFRTFSGLSLTGYARLAPTPSRHIPLPR